MWPDDDGAGMVTWQTVPGSVITSMARMLPSLMGRSGARVISGTDTAIPSVQAAEQFTNPSVCGELAEKSRVRCPPATVALQCTR